MIDGDDQFFFWNAELFCDDLPSKKNGLFLEIIAKAEIAHHLKEGVMAGSVAHIVQIIMFAAGAYAFLCGGGSSVIACLNACEEVFELYHARIGKHQCWIIARHQRARWQNAMTLAVKIVQKRGADIIERGHFFAKTL